MSIETIVVLKESVTVVIEVYFPEEGQWPRETGGTLFLRKGGGRSAG